MGLSSADGSRFAEDKKTGFDCMNLSFLFHLRRERNFLEDIFMVEVAVFFGTSQP